MNLENYDFSERDCSVCSFRRGFFRHDTPRFKKELKRRDSFNLCVNLGINHDQAQALIISVTDINALDRFTWRIYRGNFSIDYFQLSYEIYYYAIKRYYKGY